MLDQYSVSENGYFFTDVSAPTVADTSYGDLSPPVAIRFTVQEPGVTTVEIDDWVYADLRSLRRELCR